jgi:N-acetylmuramic acid 6-phosphate etherase
LSRQILDEINDLITESQNPRSIDIDAKSTVEILRLINNEDKTVPFAVEKEIPFIAMMVDIVVDAIKKGGRLFYIGAGTSGRIGFLDASEIPPTFGVDPNLIQGIIAGGTIALIKAQDGAEDNKAQGAVDLLQRGFTAYDIACGIAASRRTPFVIGAIEKAKELGAKTCFITCTPRAELTLDVDIAICPVVGPEIIMGSTRMKAGTAQKLVLNMISTTVMIRLGKVYGNMMVDLQMTSKKLEERSKRIVMMVTGVDYKTATDFLNLAHGHVKTALVMILKNVNYNDAIIMLEKCNGFVRKALEM